MPRPRVLAPLPALDEAALSLFLADRGIKLKPHVASIVSHVVASGPQCHVSSAPGLPSSLYGPISSSFSSCTSSVLSFTTSKDKLTTKLLIQLQDALSIEAVVMRHDPSTGKYCGGTRSGEERVTLCISSQVGCQMGCSFCATGAMGLQGNLSAGEILEQLLHAHAFLRSTNATNTNSTSTSSTLLPPTTCPSETSPSSTPQPNIMPTSSNPSLALSELEQNLESCGLSATDTSPSQGKTTSGSWKPFASTIRNVVFMGMGEPLNNYEAVKLAIATMVAPHGFCLSPHHITVSTVGVVPRMLSFAQDVPAPVNLALSLHAPTQELRLSIVASARAYPLHKIMHALDQYQRDSGKRVFIEYVLLQGINDSLDTAHQLGTLLAGRDVVLNLIPWNPIGQSVPGVANHRPSSPSSVTAVQAVLRGQYGIRCTVRREMGQDIAGACGQLATISRAQQGAAGTPRDVIDSVDGAVRKDSVLDIEDLVSPLRMPSRGALAGVTESSVAALGC